MTPADRDSFSVAFGQQAAVQAWVAQLQREGFAITPVETDPDLLADWDTPHRPVAAKTWSAPSFRWDTPGGTP